MLGPLILGMYISIATLWHSTIAGSIEIPQMKLRWSHLKFKLQICICWHIYIFLLSLHFFSPARLKLKIRSIYSTSGRARVEDKRARVNQSYHFWGVTLALPAARAVSNAAHPSKPFTLHTNPPTHPPQPPSVNSMLAQTTTTHRLSPSFLSPSPSLSSVSPSRSHHWAPPTAWKDGQEAIWSNHPPIDITSAHAHTHTPLPPSPLSYPPPHPPRRSLPLLSHWSPSRPPLPTTVLPGRNVFLSLSYTQSFYFFRTLSLSLNIQQHPTHPGPSWPIERGGGRASGGQRNAIAERQAVWLLSRLWQRFFFFLIS